MAKQLNVNMVFDADTNKAKQSINELTQALNKLAYGSLPHNERLLVDPSQFAEAAKQARELTYHLNNAFNVQTGKLDLSKLNTSLKLAGTDLDKLTGNFKNAGSIGQDAFLKVASAISQADQPVVTINNRIATLWTTLKNVARFQISSSIMHGLIGGVQTAFNYAQDLNESLNNIRIVTESSADQMRTFAEEANKTAKALSTTTLGVTNAALIYYQQGLSDSEVAERVETTIKLANVSRQSAEEVSSQMTAIWNNFDDGSHKLEYYADVITALGASTASSSSEIAQGVSKFAAVADTVGMSYEYATSALATLVAETRQSADTVGTGLRTLFTRLQSLELGDTLEDGTNLTKYSKALATIGVKIKDENDELKDMDQILDEVAGKWATLAKDQQVALAQTVGGVRQYVNFIALMDNWSKFQDNLAITRGSEGVLQKQADIYAESWEAARKRVKAASEELYDSLINEDFFIKVDDLFANIISGAAKFIDNLGGVKGLLVSIFGIVATSMSNQIGPMLEKFVLNLRIMTGGANKVYQEMGQKFNNVINGEIQSKKYSQSEEAQLRGYSNLLQIKTRLSQVTDNLSAKEKMEAEIAIQGIELQQKKLVELTQQKEKITRSLSNIKHDFLSENISNQSKGKLLTERDNQYDKKILNVDEITQLTENAEKVMESARIKMFNIFDDFIHNGKDKKIAIQEIFQGLFSDINLSNEINKLETEIQTAKTKIEASFNNMFSTLKLNDITQGPGKILEQFKTQLGLNSIDDIKAFDVKGIDNFLQKIKTLDQDSQNALKGLKNYLTAIKNEMTQGLNSNMEQLQNKIKLLGSSLGDTSKFAPKLASALRDIANAKSPDQLLSGLTRLQESLNGDEIAASQMKDALIAMGASEQQINEFAQDSSKLTQILKELAQTSDNLNMSMSSLNFTHYVSGVEAFTSLAAMAGNVASSINAVRSAWNTLTNEEASATEKLTSSLMAVSMLLPSIISLKTNLVKISTFLVQGTLAEKAAEQQLAVTQALTNANIEKNTVAKATNFIMTNKSIFSSKALSTEEGKETAIRALNTIGIKGNTAEKIVNTTATTGLATAEYALLAPMLLIVAAIAAVTAGIIIYNKHIHQAREAHEDAAEAAKKAREEYEKAAETYNQLKNTIESYIDAKNALTELKEGTKEWREALEKTNEEALKLIELWPELASKVKINNNGALIFEEADLESAKRASRINEVQKQVEAARTTYLEKQSAIDSTMEAAIHSGFLGLAKYTEEEISEAISALKSNKQLSTFLKYYLPRMEEEIEEARIKAYTKAYEDNPYDALGQAMASDAAEAKLYRTTLTQLGIDKDFLAGMDDIDLLSFIQSLSEKAKDLEPVITALDEFSSAENTYYTEVNSAVIKIAQDLESNNAGLAAALMDVDINKAGGPNGDIEKINLIIQNAQSFVETADVLAAQFQNNEDQLNAIIAIVRNQNPDLSGFNRQELKTFGKKFVGQAHNLGYANRLEAEDVFEGVTQDWENTFNKIFQELPKYTQKFLEDFMSNLTKFDTISPDQYKKIGEQLIEAIGLGSDLTSFESLKEMFETAGDRAGELSDVLDGVDWQTVTVSELSDKLTAAGFAADDFKVPLEKIIELMKEAAGITFDEAAEKYKNAKKVISDLEYGKEISSDNYGYLQKYEDQINEYLATHESEFDTLRHYFSRTATGDYSFKGDAEELQEIFNTVILEEFNRGLQDSIESFNALKEIADSAEGYQEKYNQANSSIEGMLSFIQTIQGENKSPEIKIAEDLYSQNSDLYQGTEGIETFKNANPEVYERLLQIFESLKNLYPELAQEIEDYEESINNFGEAVDSINTEKLKELDADVSNDGLKERVAFLKEYGTELYGINKETLNNTEAIRLIAEEMLRAEAAAKRFQSSWKDWLEGFQSGKITIQMLQDLENTYSDLLNLSQDTHLSKSFLESAENAWLMKEALDGNIEAYNELLEKASDDIIYNSFEEIRQGIEEKAIRLNLEVDTVGLTNYILSEMDRIQDELYAMGDLSIGMEIDPVKYANFYDELNNLINMAGWTADEATARLAEMGIDAEVVESDDKSVPEEEKWNQWIPARYEIRDLGQVTDAEGAQHTAQTVEKVEDARPETLTDTGEASPPKAFAIKVKSAKKGYGSGGNISHQKLGNTSSGVTPSKSSGGGSGSSGSEKKPRPLTKHAKADASERYHTINERLDNIKKAQDEAARRKERAFGAEKIAQLEKEISLRKESLELQSDYMKEIQEFLAKDKNDMTSQLGALGIKVEIDEDGVISNYQEIQDALLDMENALIDEENAYNATGDEIPDAINEQKTALEDAKKAISQYEETLNKLEDQIYSTATSIDELNDAAFELITTKVDLEIGINDDEAKLLDYYLEKYSDDAYKAAEAISIFGKQTGNTLDKIKIYETGLVDLLKSKGMTMADLSNLDDERVKSLIENGDFTEEQVEQIRDWRDSILEADQALLEMRGNIADKILDVFDEFNEKVQTQYDLFSHYKNTLQVYKDITDLMGRSVNKEQKKLISDLNNAMLENSKNTIEAAKKRYEDLVKQRAEAQALYDTALAEGGEDAAREYEELLETLDSEIKDSEEEYLSSWQETMEQAQAIFEQMIEDITDKFDEAMSGAFGSLDYLKEAFSRQSENDDLYLQDYDKLYELNKLQRDLNKTLSDTRGVTNRKELLEIQRQINEYQVEGVQLSQYDLDALRAKLEMQQAYNDLQIAQDAKHTVRLSRDAEGNWGYIYTANQEEIAQAEQQYEDKLHAYQELNDNYIQELQEKALEVQTTYRETLAEIMKDTTLDDKQRRARIEELNEWLANQQNYFNDQSLSAFNNQAETMNRMLGVYQATGADLIDLWEKTKLASLTGMDSIQDYMDNWITASDSFLYDMSDALDDRKKMLDSILELTGTSISQFANQVSSVTANIGNASEETKNQVFALSNLLNEKFSDALAQAVSWEKEYANGIIEMTEQNEKMVASLNDLIATLGTLRSYNHLHDSLDDYLTASRNYSSGKMSKEQFKTISDKFDAELREATSLDTGGYTGSWGPEGKIAVLHEHEQIFNENDTNNLLEAATILRQIDISAMSMAQGLGNLFSPSIGGFEQTLQQEVHIEAVFPDAKDHNEIEEAFDNLVNRAIQYANRKI